MNLGFLFKDHIATRRDKIDQIMSDLAIKGLVFAAGTHDYYWQDDQSMNFRPFHHFAHWCPLRTSEHVVVLAPGSKPTLLFYFPEDFWYDHTPLKSEYWMDEFSIETFGKVEDIWQRVSQFKGFAYLGPNTCEQKAKQAGLLSPPEGLNPRLNWDRGIKTDYEVYCLEKATEIAAKGHFAALQCFTSGGSEFDIHLSYLQACRQFDAELPYNGIVALDEKAAVLHYAEKRDHVRDGKVLLIDSGASFKGYGSDITRTYASSTAPSEFSAILESMNDAQLNLISNVKVGMNFGALHHSSHQALAKILKEHDLILNLSEEEIINLGITRAFYPHGIGHMLGIFVHDLGGKQIDPHGGEATQDQRYPTLRSLRTIEPGFVFTVEPGLYFINFLLQPFRIGAHTSHFNWSLIDLLMPCGGIRIEDNIAVTAASVKNLTRPYLP